MRTSLAYLTKPQNLILQRERVGDISEETTRDMIHNYKKKVETLQKVKQTLFIGLDKTGERGYILLQISLEWCTFEVIS